MDPAPAVRGAAPVPPPAGDVPDQDAAPAPVSAPPPAEAPAEDVPGPAPAATATTEPRTCNCRAGKENCMVTGAASGQCLQSSVVYGAAVKSTDTTLRTLFRFYTGS